jgi:hypothetical protein
MSADDDVNQFITDEEEQLWRESLRKAFAFCNPNPERKDCPDPKLIRDFAFHKKISDPQVFEQVTAHMAECSECVREALSYAEEYRKRRKNG